MGDTHIYLNHIEPLMEQLKRKPTKFPKLLIKRKVENIEDFNFNDFDLIGYKSLKLIKMEIAI